MRRMIPGQQLEDLTDEMFVIFAEDLNIELEENETFYFNEIFATTVFSGFNYKGEIIEWCCQRENNPEQHIMPSNWDI